MPRQPARGRPDTLSFANALRSALREDPDAILVGEMRDLETIRLALTAAETGHLVFGTLHTSFGGQDHRPHRRRVPRRREGDGARDAVESLVAVISQTLLQDSRTGPGRVAATRSCWHAAVRNLIRENKVAQMYSAIQTGNSMGMQTLDQNLADLVRRNIVSPAEARSKAKFGEFPG